MSSVRGGGFRGRGRGNTQASPSRGRGTSSRGRGFNNNAFRGSNSRGTFGQPSQGTASPAPRAANTPDINGPTPAPTQASAFGAAKARGSWQDRYQSLMTARERERSDAIRQGLIADPDKPRSLAEAITPTGTCQDMCAEYERVQRVVQKDVWNEETNPNQSAFATTEKEPDESRMVKKFRRAAAGLEEQLPSDLRPPHVLKKTCDYLFNDVIGNAASLASVHHFVWDRTRAVRNDFSIQQVTRPEELRIAIDCYERIARFHILSLHQLALPEKPYSKYDWQQEREQLDRTLLSLMQYYDDSRGRIELTNEAEFRSYCVIFQLQDPTPDLDDRVQTWPKQIIQDLRVRKAVDLYMAACNVMDAQGPLKPRANHLIARQDWQRFWTLVASKEVSYLMACVAEIYFNLVRRMVLNALFRTFRMNSSLATPDWTIDTLCEMLAFDDGDEVYNYCERFGFSFKEREDGQQYLDLTSVRGRTLPEPNAGMPKQTKTDLVENKRFGRTLPAVINGLAVRQAQDLGLVNQAEDEDESMEETVRDRIGFGESLDGTAKTSNEVDDDGESLFVPETRKPDIFKAPSFNPFLNGAKTEQSSIFSRGQSGTSTFGKPSVSNDQPSIFAQRPGQTAEAPATSASFVNGGATFQPASPVLPWTNTAPQSTSIFDFSSKKNPAATKEDDEAEQISPFTQKSTDQSSIFARVAPPPPASPFFSFGRPSQIQNSEQAADISHETSDFATPFAPTVESEPPSPEPPNSPLTFGLPAAAPAAQVPSFSTQPPETRVSQPQFTSTSPTSTSTSNNQLQSSTGLGLTARRSSSSTDTKPKRPSPLSNSITPGDQNSALVTESSAPAAHNTSTRESLLTAQQIDQSAQATAAEEFNALITRLTDELLNNPISGLFKQYIEFAVSRTIKQVHAGIVTEQDNQKAELHRQFRLCLKYGTRWKDVFWQRRLAKTGRERRERRQRRLQQRESQEVEGSSLYDWQSERGRSRAESRFEDPEGRQSIMGGAVSAIFKGESPFRVTTNEQRQLAGTKRPISSHEPDVPRESGHKRLKSTSHVDERGRVAKPTLPSHPNIDSLGRSLFKPRARSKDTTNSTYFRLKALGVSQAVRSAGLHSTKKRRSESLQTSSQTSPPGLRPSSRLDISLGRSTPRALMPPPSSTPSRTLKTTDDDEALFARLKAARESLKQGAFFSPQDSANKGDELRRSASSQSSTESPSMARARMEARLRASQSLSASGMTRPDREVPAYRMRYSKFVPRAEYTKAIDRARENRESRSREISRPESPEDDARLAPASNLLQIAQPVDHQKSTQHTSNAFPGSIANSSSHISAFENGTSAFVSPSKLFAAANEAPVSFANHTTQLSSENPFLHTANPQTFGSFASPPTFGSKDNGPSVFNTQDHTIRPTQIHQSLASTFGKSSTFGQTSFKAVPQSSPTPPQQDSYLQSQAISLLSDDEDDEAPAPAVRLHQYQAATETDATEELLDDATDDDANYMSYVTNSYAAQVGQSDRDGDDSLAWDSQFEGVHGQSEVEEDAGEDSEGDVNGYASDEPEDEEEDENAVDGDIDEEETEDADDDADGFGSEDEGEEEEDGGYNYPPPGPWQPQVQGHAWASPAPKSSALQDVGNSAEEAIELSD